MSFLLVGSSARSEDAGWDAGWIDNKTASSVLPYAYISQDVYGSSRTVAGWSRIAEWTTIFSRGGLAGQIDTATAAGFYAALYRNNATGELTIAYRGSETTWNDWETNIESRSRDGTSSVPFCRRSRHPRQNAISESSFDNCNRALFGWRLATYASQQSPGVITKVVTFNSARPPIVSSTTSGRINQINVIVPGELISDPYTKTDLFGLTARQNLQR